MADTPHDPGTRYTVTARKYRPQTFADLVAQEHVAETLRNAITRGRLAHAYLFSGPRGVGKTTAARILAKAVNCQTPLAERPDAEPCRTCDSCRAFEEGRSLNIIEIDAASNNRVEDVRELRDTVRVPPQGANKKVYILDEVHMLSASAFNALLKTLEEPPDYALFIFATTEPHKVLPTILSRTQRFDFRRIAVPEIVSRLEEISAAEGVTADDESLVLLARKGDGALRDALSIYDQAVSICGPAPGDRRPAPSARRGRRRRLLRHHRARARRRPRRPAGGRRRRGPGRPRPGRVRPRPGRPPAQPVGRAHDPVRRLDRGHPSDQGALPRRRPALRRVGPPTPLDAGRGDGRRPAREPPAAPDARAGPAQDGEPGGRRRPRPPAPPPGRAGDRRPDRHAAAVDAHGRCRGDVHGACEAGACNRRRAPITCRVGNVGGGWRPPRVRRAPRQRLVARPGGWRGG